MKSVIKCIEIGMSFISSVFGNTHVQKNNFEINILELVSLLLKWRKKQ